MNHGHEHCCEHEHLAYCKVCQVVYCKDCHKEWRETTYYWGTSGQPYWVGTGGGTSVYPISGTSSDTVPAKAIEGVTITCHEHS